MRENGRPGIAKSLYEGVRHAFGLGPPGTRSQIVPQSTDAPSVNRRIVLGCVADNKPAYLYEALRLLQSVRWFGGPSAECDFILCIVGSADPLYSRHFRRLGAKIRVVQPYSEISPATNKLRFWQLPELANYQRAVCLDCDTIVVRDPLTPLERPGLHARMAGLPTVPHDVFIKMFAAFRLKIPERSYRCVLSGEATIVYLNNGVLAMDPPTVADLVPRWIRFTDALLKSEIMREHKWFIEQAALTLALVESGCPFHLLGNEMNFPFPGAGQPLVEDVDPRIIHHHHHVELSGRVKLSGYPLVDARIDAFNRKLWRAFVVPPSATVRRKLGNRVRKLLASHSTHA